MVPEIMNVCICAFSTIWTKIWKEKNSLIGTIFYVKRNDIYIVFSKIYVRIRKRNIIQFIMCTKLVGLVLSLK